MSKDLKDFIAFMNWVGTLPANVGYLMKNYIPSKNEDIIRKYIY